MAKSRANKLGLNKNEINIHELIKKAKKGDEEAFRQVKEFVMPEIKKMQDKSNLWVFGYDRDDIEQECGFMLLKAIKNYCPSRCKNFRFYVRILFKGRIISLIQESKRYKNVTLNVCASLDDNAFRDNDGNNYSLYELIPESEELLMDLIVDKDYFGQLKFKIYEYLTQMEKQIFDLYLESYSYEDISKILGCQTKSVDNAIQRAKNKIPIIMQNEIKENSDCSNDPTQLPIAKSTKVFVSKSQRKRLIKKK
jgi:RNA polymerase sporulation-specific sigma factor